MTNKHLKFELFYDDKLKKISAEQQFCTWYDKKKDLVTIKFVTQGGNNFVSYITVFYYV